jgi:uncharacterized protein (TIGR00251 family)
VCRLRIVPRARVTAFAGTHGDRLKIRVGAPPLDGRANAELIAFLARQFGVPRRRIRLAAGDTSRDKTVEVDTPAKLPEAVTAALGLDARE